MTTNEYLAKILEQQDVTKDDSVMSSLAKHREDVEQLIEKSFSESSPTIRYGGSKAKGTMVKDSYDLDIACYFPRNDDEPGASLEEIYNNVDKALQEKYFTDRKRTAIRLKNKDGVAGSTDFHIDVVPGRFIDESESDAYLHQEGGDKSWLKTNLDTHIKHIRVSGFTDAIKLFKIWRCRFKVEVRTFALDLLVVKILKDRGTPTSLDEQAKYVLEYFRDNKDSLCVEDPANSGNDLSSLLDTNTKASLASSAEHTLGRIKDGDWQTIFGVVLDTTDDKAKTIGLLASSVVNPIRPYGGE